MINTFGIGDVLLCTPAIAAIRRRFHKAHITFLAREGPAELLCHNPHLDGIISGDFSYRNPIRGYHLAILLTYHPMQTLASLPVPGRIGYLSGHEVTSNGFPVVSRRWSGSHLVELGNGVAEALGCPNPGTELQIYLQESERRAVDRYLPNQPFLAVNLQTKVPSKSWPLDRMELVIRWSPLPVVLVGGATDRRVAEKVGSVFPAAINLVGKLSLRHTAAVLERCAAFVTADSGPMHLGFAVGAPTVAIFGYTDPNQIFLPSPERILLYHKKSCAPHFRVGDRDDRYRKCLTGDCMKAVQVQEVVAALTSLLKRQGVELEPLSHCFRPER